MEKDNMSELILGYEKIGFLFALMNIHPGKEDILSVFE